jgi:hypothetical protein
MYENNCGHKQEMPKFLCPSRFSKSGLHGHHSYNCYTEFNGFSSDKIAGVIKVFF